MRCQCAEAVLALADNNGLVRFRLICAPPLGAENEFKQDHQPYADCKRENGHRQNISLDISQFAQTPHSRGTVCVGSGENPRLYIVEFGINIGSIQLVCAGQIAGIDRSEHAINCKEVFLVYRKHIADQDAVSGLAQRARALHRR